jgi:amidase
VGRAAAVRSLLVGAGLGLVRTKARRLRPLDLSPFDAAMATLSEQCPSSAGPGTTVADVRVAFDEGSLSAESLLLHHLARIRELDGRLGSVIEIDPGALDAARASDERRRSGAVLGPLDGVPVTVKDNTATAGPMRTTGGAVVLADHVAEHDAPIVERLRAAGAVIVGKANLSELAGAVARRPGLSAVGGPTANPYGPRFSPGGSSSGSAVGVAAGLTLLSVGTETSGSLIAPASFNGVVGMKPSRGVVPSDGVIPLVPTQDSPGPVARTVADAAALLTVLSGGSVRPELSADALRGARAGVLAEQVRAFRTPLEDTSDADAVLARIGRSLRAAGAEVVETVIGPPEAVAELDGDLLNVVLGGLTWDTIGALAGLGAPFDDLDGLLHFNLRQPRQRMPGGQFFVDAAVLRPVDEATYRAAASANVERAAALLDSAFTDAAVDLLVSVSNCHSPIYAAAGYPAVTVPVGLRANGMPTGAVLIGRGGDDAKLLEWAHAFEQAEPLRVPPPV